MAKTTLAVKVEARPSFRDTRGRFHHATDKLLESYRDEMRLQGRRLVRELKAEAPKDSGEFANNIRFRTFATSGVKGHLGFRATMPQPLGTFITQGTKPHIIRAVRAKALFFFWGKVSAFTVVPKAGGFTTHWSSDGKLIIGKGHVNHPGTKPNDFVERAYDKWWAGAKRAFARIALNFGKEIARK